jgi:hypothetical protein
LRRAVWLNAALLRADDKTQRSLKSHVLRERRMPIHEHAKEADWTRLLVPVVVLLASVAACSVMPPADAGTPASACVPGRAEYWVGRAASAEIVEQARLASGSQSVRLVMPEDRLPEGYEVDRLNLVLDAQSVIRQVSCS